MKFIAPLGFRYGDNGDHYSHVTSVYGPYEDDAAVEQALVRLWPGKKELEFLVFEGQIVKVKPSPKEKPENEKRPPGNMENYVKDGERYKCKDCGRTILGARVAHPVHWRGMHGAGSGECRYEDVPYCPNCETEPNHAGVPVYE